MRGWRHDDCGIILVVVAQNGSRKNASYHSLSEEEHLPHPKYIQESCASGQISVLEARPRRRRRPGTRPWLAKGFTAIIGSSAFLSRSRGLCRDARPPKLCLPSRVSDGRPSWISGAGRLRPSQALKSIRSGPDHESDPFEGAA